MFANSWVLENITDEKIKIVMKTGIDWIQEPNFLIKRFIEKDINASKVKMGKYLRSIYSL